MDKILNRINAISNHKRKQYDQLIQYISLQFQKITSQMVYSEQLRIRTSRTINENWNLEIIFHQLKNGLRIITFWLTHFCIIKIS